MKKIIVILLLFNLSFALKAQDSIAIKGQFKLLEIDKLGNIYAISKWNDIHKYNEHGIKLAEMNLKSYGEISAIDVSNAFEIFVFYKDQNKILTLDNQLNFKNEINLNQINQDNSQSMGFNFYSSFCRSFDNNFWIFNQDEMRLVKINNNNDVLHKSNTILLNSDTVLLANSMLNNSMYLIVLFGNEQIAIYDALGNPIRLLKHDHINDIQLEQNHIIIITSNGQCIDYDIELLKESEFYNLEQTFENAIITKNKIVYCDLENLYIIVKNK